MLKAILVRYEGVNPGEKKFRTKHNRSMSAGHEAMGLHWIRGGVRQRHFEPAAHFRYGFAPRSVKYRARKLRLTGKDIDLMFTDGSMRETTHSRVVPTSKRARMRIPAGYLNMTVGAINMREELMRFKDDDVNQMSAAFQISYDLTLRAQRSTETETIVP